ncbi:alpha-hydroxy-acid oxidizing protein [Cellulomonas sp. PhB143]|uniref:alpha-hydroxy-acid oxidizing protein n=1 Tax=Cellulomonas sp. PhB143 TaxID=2485186 RepID=UPI000F94DD15|nr:alpha-hydroxy-acid oxidizing protein [Cellulomonas sp. PhB143]ROS75315.1 isopentenyl diphosphate isomerase/L-lactate dehydrogenase-like FMN-dependent dehydrogenase [Cellulomonas sp. PhB143]
MSDGPGRTRQDEVYRAGVLGRRPAVPTDPDALAAAARRRMSRTAWAYVAGGAGAERTVAANRAAFDRWELVPRMLGGAAGRDLSVELLGTRLPAPVLLAPVGAAGLVRRDADLLIGGGAADAGVPYVLSNQGSSPMERTAEVMGSAPRWFQLYWSRDEALVDSLVGRAEAIGAGALVVTLDTTVLGWRPRDLDLGSLPFARGIGIAQYTSDPRFAELVRERLGARGTASSGTASSGRNPRPTLAAVRSLLSIAREHPGPVRANLRSPVPRAAVETFLDVYSNPALSWDHLATLRGRTRLPIVLKGILHPDDARRALDLGADAIMVSNHGGRQVDRSVASLDALVDVRDAVGPDATVLLDSGIRTGADVLVALALGADAVTLGRPHVYGLALAGRAGVAEVVRDVVAELDLTLGLVGARSVAEVGRELVRERRR